jgi:hypothetical protein
MVNFSAIWGEHWPVFPPWNSFCPKCQRLCFGAIQYNSSLVVIPFRPVAIQSMYKYILHFQTSLKVSQPAQIELWLPTRCLFFSIPNLLPALRIDVNPTRSSQKKQSTFQAEEIAWAKAWTGQGTWSSWDINYEWVLLTPSLNAMGEKCALLGQLLGLPLFYGSR